MSFNLGLEALSDEGKFGVTADVLSYEFLDTVMQFNAEASEAVVIADGIGSLCSAYENLEAICDVLAEHGNSPALEALVGGNFREGFSIEAASNAKEGLWARFVKWLKTMWAKIKAFFAKFVSSSKAMRTKLRERVQEIRNAGGIEEVSIKCPELSAIEYNNNAMKALFEEAIEKINASISDPEHKLNVEEMQKKVEGDKDPLERMFGVSAGQEVNIDMNKAIAMLEKVEIHLAILEKAQAKIDKVADKIEKESFSITKKDRIPMVGKGDKVKAETETDPKDLNDTEIKEHNQEAKRYNKELDDKASDDFRSRMMKYHSEYSKYLSKATKNAISDASYLLSAFKPKKKKG